MESSIPSANTRLQHTSPVPILLVGNFLSGSGGSRGVCEEMALRFKALGWPVVTASEKRPRLLRLLDMLATTWSRRADYAVAQVDVYSGPAFLWAEAVCASLRVLGKPYILTLHGGNLPAFARGQPQRVKRLLGSATVVTAPSPYLFEQMASYRPDLLLLPNAIDLALYSFRLRANPQPRLVWLRALHQIYNPVLGPKVLALLLKDFPEARLNMIGPDKADGSLERVKEAAAAAGLNGQLRLVGSVSKSNVPAWLNAGDIFLNTANVDNTPVSVLEAMASGLCIVSTNAGGLPYFVKDGAEGLLVPVNDAQAMAAAVRRFLHEPQLAAQLSRQARAKAEQHDWSGILPKWEALFNSVAAGALPVAVSPSHPLAAP